MTLASTHFCLRCMLECFVLFFVDDGRHLLHVKASLYVNETWSNAKYRPESLYYWMWMAPPRVPQFEFKTGKWHSKTGINWTRNLPISCEIRTKPVSQTFWSVVVAALGLQKVQEGQNQGLWLALGTLLGLFWRFIAVQKPFKRALEEV